MVNTENMAMETMKKNNLNSVFLKILKAFLEESCLEVSEISGLSEADWHILINMAESHKLLSPVYEVVHEFLDSKYPKLAMYIKKTNKQQVMLQTIKTTEFLDMYKKLSKLGIKPLVVKGIICRRLYPKPDFRLSSDEDMLIEGSMLEACDEELIKQGFYRVGDKAITENDYVISYRKKESPLYIELNNKMFSPTVQAYNYWNDFFTDAHHNAVSEIIDGVEVYSMGYTEHLLYLICHALKHFVSCGVGIRQICDIVMYANRYGDKVDWYRLYDCCVRMHGELFAASVFKIGKEFLVFDEDKAAYPDIWKDIKVDELPLLEDLMSAGIYGKTDTSRIYSCRITLNAASGKDTKTAVLRAIFPPLDFMKERNTYLKKCKWLLPAAWISRIFGYLRKTMGKKDNSAIDSVRIGQQRIELLKLYRVM